MFKLNAKLDADLLLYSVILNVMWLLGYNAVLQSVLVVLTMGGLFPDGDIYIIFYELLLGHKKE